MKKRFLVILGIFTIILIFIIFLLYNYSKLVKQAESFNKQYQSYYEKEIIGTELATLLNKVADYNEKNGIDKTENNRYYIETEESISVEIRFLEKEEIVKMEDILEQGIENFIKYYATAHFKCTQVNYHNENMKIKDLYFEQI